MRSRLPIGGVCSTFRAAAPCEEIRSICRESCRLEAFLNLPTAGRRVRERLSVVHDLFPSTFLKKRRDLHSA